jgi:hypothetical protein
MSFGNYTSTTIDHNYETIHPLRDKLQKYRHQKFSEITFRKILQTWEHKMNSEWVVSGTSMLDDWLIMTPRGQNLLGKISKDMDLKKEYYEIQ